MFLKTSQFSRMEVFQKVTVNVKVLEVKETVPIAGKRKQDIIIADQTGTAKVSLWEEHIDTMRDGACYQLKNFTIRDFQSTRYLSMSKEGTEITSTVAQQSDTEEVITLENVMVIGVPHLNIYKDCLL